MDVAYEIQSTELDEVFFEEQKQEYIAIMEDIKSNVYNEIKKYAKGEDIDSFVKAEVGYNSFEEYFNTEYMNGTTIEETAQEYYNEKLAQYKGETLNNIFINLSKQQNGQNILFVAHYDSDIESSGAGDDGIAVASLLETIRCRRDVVLKNNIYVLITDGEENNYWGAKEFIKNTNIDFDLVINFDNSGNSGNPILYHYSNDSIAKQYFKSVKNESSYSFSNDILFKYIQGDVSDAFKFIENGYNTLDFSLIGTPQYYHSKNDTFENIDVNSLNTLTKTMITLVDYYGNNDVQVDSNYKSVNYKIINGIEFSVNRTTYIALSILVILANLVFSIIMFKKKEKIIKRILSILCIVFATIVLAIFQNFSLLISLPLFIYSITNCFESYINRDKNEALNKINQENFNIFIESNQDSELVDIINEIANLKHDLFDVKMICTEKDNYYVSVYLNTNWICPSDLYIYDKNEKKLKLIFETCNETILDVNENNFIY